MNRWAVPNCKKSLIFLAIRESSKNYKNQRFFIFREWTGGRVPDGGFWKKWKGGQFESRKRGLKNPRKITKIKDFLFFGSGQVPDGSWKEVTEYTVPNCKNRRFLTIKKNPGKIINHRLQTTNHRLLTTDYRLPITNDMNLTGFYK